MIFFKKFNSKGDIIAQSLEYTIENGTEKEINGEEGKLAITIQDKDLIKSSRIFRKVSKICYDMFNSVYKYYQKIYIAQSHSLKKIHGQIGQSIDGIISNSVLSSAENHEQQKQIISKLITKNPEETADTLIYIKKKILEIGAHMLSFEILHMGKKIPIYRNKHNIRRLILNVWHGFDDNFKEKNIKYKFLFEDEISEKNKCFLDFKTVNAALFNLFDNAVKYIKPNSDIEFDYKIDKKNFNLSISMISMKINPNEIDNLCTFGFRGENCKEIEGSGVGLYVVKKALKLNGLKFKITTKPKEYVDEENKKIYTKNTFHISGKVNN